MTRSKSNEKVVKLKSLLSEDESYLRVMVQELVQDALEAEMEETIGAGRYERSETRRGRRSGYYTRSLITRVGTLELRVPQDRNGEFSTQLFERYQRSEKALVSALAEMYVQGFSASAISQINKGLDAQLESFSTRRLDEEYPYLILDARYERVRENGTIGKKAVLVAIGVNWDGRRSVLATEVENRESHTSWKEFLVGLVDRGLHGVEFVVSDDHAGLKAAIQEVLTHASWQRCYVHFLRNAVDKLPRKADDDCLRELRWLYERRNVKEALSDLASWIEKWQARYPKLCDWVEENIEETLTFYRLPAVHHKHMKSTNMLERLNQEIKRRTNVVRIFPNEASCLRLIRALAVETHENWIEATRYLNMDLLREHKKELLRTAAA